MEEQLQKLYDNLVRAGYTAQQIGSFDTFSTNIKDPDKNQKFYESLITSGKVSVKEIGTYDTFKLKTLGGDDIKKKDQPSSPNIGGKLLEFAKSFLTAQSTLAPKEASEFTPEEIEEALQYIHPSLIPHEQELVSDRDFLATQRSVPPPQGSFKRVINPAMTVGEFLEAHQASPNDLGLLPNADMDIPLTPEEVIEWRNVLSVNQAQPLPGTPKQNEIEKAYVMERVLSETARQIELRKMSEKELKKEYQLSKIFATGITGKGLKLAVNLLRAVAAGEEMPGAVARERTAEATRDEMAAITSVKEQKQAMREAEKGGDEPPIENLAYTPSFLSDVSGDVMVLGTDMPWFKFPGGTVGKRASKSILNSMKMQYDNLLLAGYTESQAAKSVGVGMKRALAAANESGMALAGYAALNNATSQLADGIPVNEIDFGSVIEDGIKDYFIGAPIGVIGSYANVIKGSPKINNLSNRFLVRSMAKAGVNTTALATEGAVFAYGGALMDRGDDETVLEALRRGTKDVPHSIGVIGMMRASNLRNAMGERIPYNAAEKRVLERYNVTEKESWNRFVQDQKLRDDILMDPNVPWTMKAKVAAYAEGIAPEAWEPPVRSYQLERIGDRHILTTRDENRRPIEVEEYRTRSEALDASRRVQESIDMNGVISNIYNADPDQVSRINSKLEELGYYKGIENPMIERAIATPADMRSTVDAEMVKDFMNAAKEVVGVDFRASKPSKPQSEGDVPPKGESASETPSGMPKATYRADEMVEYIPTNELPKRKQLAEEVFDFLNNETGEVSKDNPVMLKKEGVFTQNSARNLLGEANMNLTSKEQVESLKQGLKESISNIDAEISKRAEMPAKAEGEIEYGGRRYNDVEALKEDLRKVDNLERLPQPDMDIDVMRAIDAVKQERAQQPKTETDADQKPQETIITLYRGGKGEGGRWYTPDQDAAKEYASDFGGGVKERKFTLRKVAETEDVMRVVKELNIHGAKNESFMSMLAPESFDGADAIIKQLRKEGYDAIHLPKGEDFTPSGRAIESYKLLKPASNLETKTQSNEPVQKQSPEGLDVRQQTKDGEKVGEGDAQKQEAPPQEGGLSVLYAGSKPPSKPPPPTTTTQGGAEGELPKGLRDRTLEAVQRTLDQRQKALSEEAKSPAKKGLVSKIGEEVFDREYHIKRLLKKANADDAMRVIRDMNLRHGATAAAAVATRRAYARVYGDPLLPGRQKQLNKPQQRLLNDAIDNMRVIEIEEYRNRQRNQWVVERAMEMVGENKKMKKRMGDLVEEIGAGAFDRATIDKRLNALMGDKLLPEQLESLWREAEAEIPSLKHEGGMTLETAYDFLQAIEEKDSRLLSQYGAKEKDVDLALFKERADSYWEAMRESLRQYHESGIISDELYRKLKKEYPYYSPRVYMQYVDVVDGKGGVSGIQALGEGSVGAKITNMEMLLHDNIMRSRIAAFNNRMVNSMATFAKQNPKNGFMMVAKEQQMKQLPTAEKGVELYSEVLAEIAKTRVVDYAETPKNMVAVDYYEAGTPRRLWVDKTIHEAMFVGDKYEALNRFMSATGVVLGTPLLRAGATGYNPEFAVKNLVLDAMHSWASTTEYAAFAPKAMTQYAKDISAVYKDALLRQGRYLDYIEEGGGMEFLSDQGKFQKGQIKKGYSTAKANLREVGDAMGYIGNSSEVLMRLAVRERAIRNGMERFKAEYDRDPNPQELKDIQRDATAVARGYVDFNQGGNTAKALNHVIPYLNAGLQVTSTSARAIAKDPVTWVAKVMQVAGVAGAAAAHNMGMFPGGDEDDKAERREAYLHHLSDTRKGNEVIIMTDKYYTDSNGNKRYLYIHIPLDAFQHNIKNFAEDMVIKNLSGDAYKDYKLLNQKQAEGLKATTRTLTDVAALPPVAKAAVGYMANYDFYYNEPIWPGQEFGKDKSMEAFWDYTPERFVELGKKTGLSPVRTQYVAKQLVTGSNMFATALGEGVDALARAIDPELHEVNSKNTAKTLRNTPFVRRFVGLTNPYGMGDKVKEKQGQYNAMRAKNNLKLQEILDSELSEDDKVAAVDGLFESLLETNQLEARRILSRYYTNIGQGDAAQHPYVWLTRVYDPSVRAELYHEQTKSMVPDQREFMDNSIAEIPDIISEAFYVRLNELRQQDGVLEMPGTE